MCYNVSCETKNGGIKLRESYLKVLSDCELFTDVEHNDLIKIVDSYGELVTSEKNEIIFSETHYSRSLVIILKGSASVTKAGGNGSILMSILDKGDIFGMAALFYEEDNFLTEIKANEKVSMIFISKDNLKEIFKLCPKVCENYITILSEKIHFLNKKISALTKPEALQKVASFILQYYDPEQHITVLPYSITKAAEAINTGRASVYRAFDELEKDNIIRRNGRRIEILDLDALKNL